MKKKLLPAKKNIPISLMLLALSSFFISTKTMPDSTQKIDVDKKIQWENATSFNIFSDEATTELQADNIYVKENIILSRVFAASPETRENTKVFRTLSGNTDFIKINGRLCGICVRNSESLEKNLSNISRRYTKQREYSEENTTMAEYSDETTRVIIVCKNSKETCVFLFPENIYAIIIKLER